MYHNVKYHKFIAISLFFFLIILSIFLYGCNQIIPNNRIYSNTEQKTEVYNTSSYIKSYSIDELTNKAKVILIGTANKPRDILNIARDINDNNKPAADLFGVGQIYEFTLVKLLKNGKNLMEGDTVNIVQFEGMTPITEGEKIDENLIKEARSSEKYRSFLVDNNYILFLADLVGFPDLKNYYTGIAHPWRFLIYKDCVYPETPWEGARYYFPVQRLDEFVAQIEQALTSTEPLPTRGWSPPTPAPTSSQCALYPYEPQPLPLSGTPYP
jgi:hypothetical protein